MMSYGINCRVSMRSDSLSAFGAAGLADAAKDVVALAAVRFAIGDPGAEAPHEAMIAHDRDRRGQKEPAQNVQDDDRGLSRIGHEGENQARENDSGDHSEDHAPVGTQGEPSLDHVDEEPVIHGCFSPM